MEDKNKNSLSKLLSFEGIQDPRIDRKKLYPLDEILFLTICSVVSGYSEWEEITDFGESKLAWLRKYFPYKNGIPSHDTINRTIGLMAYRSFETFFISWVESIAGNVGGKLINVDGKKLRGSVDKTLQQTPRKAGGKSAIHLVEAWCSELQLCLGQYKTADKSNEITAIPALLEMLELCGCTVTIDAMGCQKDIAALIRGKEADYILGLKGNQETIHNKVKELFERRADTLDAAVEETVGHGRVEVRECRVLSAELLDESIRAPWKGLNTLIEVCSTRWVVASNKHSIECRYYLASKIQDAAAFNTEVRGHWGIENELHWTMDVTFGEDRSRKRAGNVAQNFGLIRRIALNLLKNNNDKPRVSLNRKMNKCSLSDKYREKTFKF